MTNPKILVRACDKIVDMIDEAISGGEDSLRAIDRLRGAVYAAETRLSHNRLREIVPGIHAISWSLIIGEDDGEETMRVGRVHFLDSDGEELYAHCVHETGGGCDVSFTKEFASALLGDYSVTHMSVNDLTSRLTDTIKESFDLMERLATQAYVMRSETEGSSLLAPVAPVAMKDPGPFELH